MQEKKPLVVYLDSSDYSELSNPRLKDPGRDALRTELLRWSKSGAVQFAFSAVHLSEMAPLDPAYSPAATARAELLSDLCGRNCFIPFDELIKLELGRAMAGHPSKIQPLSSTGDWFPPVEDIMPPVQIVPTLLDELDAMGKERGLSRKSRRELKQKLITGDRQLKPIAKRLMAKGTLDVNEIIARYPMRPDDARIMGNYVMGRGDRDAAKEAFLNSLRDPQWMMRWFAEHYDKLNPLIAWFREPAQKMEQNMRELATKAQIWRKAAARVGKEKDVSRFLSQEGWTRLQDELLEGLASRLSQTFYPGNGFAFNSALIDSRCPGLSTAVRSMHSSLWTAVGAQPRDPQDNDFVDAMHALNAPYCDFFRADRYMSSHVQRHAKQYGTEVVSRLRDLPSRIAARLSNE